MKRKILSATGKVLHSPIRHDADHKYKQQLLELEKGGIYPLDAPGLPLLPANSAFLAFLQSTYEADDSAVTEETVKGPDGKKTKIKKLVYTDALQKLVRRALREVDFSMPVEVGPQKYKDACFVPGHLWLANTVTGPRPADVMIITKNPWDTEVRSNRCLIGDDGILLQEMFRKQKVQNLSKFYVTHLVKFMPPDNKSTLKAVWLKDAMHLLWQEIKIVQPKYILCLGTEPSKALITNRPSVTDMDGRVETLKYTTAFSASEEKKYEREAKVMTVVHPKFVLRDQSAQRQLENGVARFSALVSGLNVEAAETVDHTVIDSYEELLQKLVEIENDQDKHDKIVAVDAEWHGQHPINAGAYMRTMQISWLPKKAIGIKLHLAGGAVNPGFEEDGKINPRVITLLNMYFNGGKLPIGRNGSFNFKKKRVVGHFFNADLEWLLHYGINIQDRFSCPLHDYEMHKDKRHTSLYKKYEKEGFKRDDTVPAWFRTKFEGGADTGLMAHAIEEATSYKLETLAMRYTTAPRYDQALQEWRDSYCKANGLSAKNMEGYGECPDDVLLPYGMYDVDVTLRLFYKFDVLLDEDYEGNNCREAFWESQIATPAVLEIHRTGILVDKERNDFLTKKFIEAKSALEDRFKKKIKWPDFNIRSTIQVRELLFGHKLNGTVDKATGQPIRVRPADAYSLQVEPIFDTSKPPKLWKDLVKMRKDADASPSTNKQSLSLLAQRMESKFDAELINDIRDYRFLDQVLKTVLRPPVRDKSTDEIVLDDDGYMTYEDGLVSMACDDGRVRTHIYQTKETGRWSSARPNLQNISKQRDPDYKRLLGAENYKYSLRSILRASPGHVLVEADYVGAELYGMAVMSGDPTMIEHATRNQLDESSPDYYDIHSNVAVRAFKLDCPPTKTGLEAIGKKTLRIVAKSVIFGIAYGRGPKAIAVAAKEQGIDVSVEEAKAIIDAIFTMYPDLVPFFDECRRRATGTYTDPETKKLVESRTLSNCFGRLRRFQNAEHDEALAAEFQRQAMNFPIQSMIASVVSRALAYLYDYKTKMQKQGKDLFRILLQIHDAILLEVPYQHVEEVCTQVLPRYMRESVPIFPTSLDGVPTGAGPYYLGLEGEVMEHWGEKVSYEFAKRNGLPTGKGKTKGCVFTFSKDKPKE